METFWNLLKRVYSILAAIVIALTSLSIGNNFHIARDPEVLLRVAMVSDTHITDQLYRRAVFLPGLLDISRHVQPDLFLCAGDCTDSGNEANWAAFQGMLNRHLSVDQKIIALGNHDTWISYSGDHDYAPARDNYLHYANAIMGTAFDTVWFTREIGGYTFIVMGSEATSTGATISEQQLAWLASALEEAAAKAEGKPVFVINHQPLNFTHTVGDNENSNGYEDGAASDRVRALLTQYENIVYISGHQHYNLDADGSGEIEGFQTVEALSNGVVSVNLPSYEYGTFLTIGTGLLGQGIVMDLYADKLVLRGRNFFLSNWQKDFEVTIPLQ